MLISLFRFFVSMPLIMMTLYVHASCISGNCYNGKGTFIFKDGSKYGGSFLRGKPHGQGTYHYKDGSVYTGSFHQGLKHGLGKMTFKSKDVYTGHFEKGTISGEGKMTYANGDIYLGIWQQGKFNGLGKYLFSNGDRYEGNFVNGSFTGTGRFTKTDGTYYEGEWLENKKNGNGKSYKNGELTNTFFKMDVLVDENNTKVSSESNFPLNNSKKFENDVLINCNDEYCHNTKGKLTYKDGSVFTGDFINGKGEGLGSCKYANGDYYEGGWKNHAPHGQGTMHFAKGNIYAAIWENGVPKQKINSQYQNSIPSTASTTTIKKSDNTTKIYALIAGVATYNHMPSLKYTDDDAYHLYAFLKSPEGGALPDDNIKIIVDDAVTRKSLLQELNTMTAKADENDVVLVYLSGHGLDGYYVPSDFDGSKNQVSYDDILEIINNSSAKHKLFITDACHSGSMMVAARSPYNVALENFYSAYNSVKGGTAIMMSSKKEEVSLEYGGLRQGVFSHYLIKGLKGYADTNKDKLITISELYDYVSTNVATYSANAQHPVIMGDYDNNMPVAWIRQ